MDLNDFARYLSKLDRTKSPKFASNQNVAQWVYELYLDRGSASESFAVITDFGEILWNWQNFWDAEAIWALNARALNLSAGAVNIPALAIAANGTASYESYLSHSILAASKGTANFLFGDFLYQSSADNRYYFHGTSDYFAWTPSVGIRYHAVLTTQGVTGNAKLTIDGTEYSCTQGGGSHNTPAFGNMLGPSSGTGYFSGTVDEVRIYKDRVIGSAEIAYNYNSGFGRAAPYSEQNLALWYHGNQYGPDLIRDYGTASLHGTPSANVSVVEAVPLDGEVARFFVGVAGHSILGGLSV